MFVRETQPGRLDAGSEYEDFGLATLPLRAPSLVDEDILAVNLVNAMRDEEDDEESDRTHRQEEIDRVLQNR